MAFTLEGRDKSQERRKWKRARVAPLVSTTDVIAHKLDDKKSKRTTLEQLFLDMLNHIDRINLGIAKAIASGNKEQEHNRKALREVHISRMHSVSAELKRQGRFIAG